MLESSIFKQFTPIATTVINIWLLPSNILIKNLFMGKWRLLYENGNQIKEKLNFSAIVQYNRDLQRSTKQDVQLKIEQTCPKGIRIWFA